MSIWNTGEAQPKYREYVYQKFFDCLKTKNRVVTCERMNDKVPHLSLSEENELKDLKKQKPEKDSSSENQVEATEGMSFF